MLIGKWILLLFFKTPSFVYTATQSSVPVEATQDNSFYSTTAQTNQPSLEFPVRFFYFNQCTIIYNVKHSYKTDGKVKNQYL